MFNLKIVQVKEESMSPRLKNNAFLLVKTNYLLKDLSRDNIIVFRSTLNDNLLLIKRIIGTPGDLIQISNTGKILINSQFNFEIAEEKENNDFWIQYEWSLGKKEFIVLGDNRDKSEDSRKFGPITHEQIVGKAIFNLSAFRFLK